MFTGSVVRVSILIAVAERLRQTFKRLAFGRLDIDAKGGAARS